MWPRRSHILAPLTDSLKNSSVKQFSWTLSHDAAFNQMKDSISKDSLLGYPDHDIPFDIETDASHYQFGAVIQQNGKPVAFYTRTPHQPQKNDTTIETKYCRNFIQFRSMLSGAKINII
jgi:hypothetical protein